ncbi:glycosyltransferase [Aestuariimicrobium ganziense]|uniref:glycosyltransferase n=1 Tax=Aestuariimicrobium ganziense TaxID=2773677 RepID=UPI001941772C|nr:glycosyltransferase [Aestuariimicrobium ganziense]
MPPTPRTALWVAPVSNLAGVARHIIDTARVGVPGWDLVVAAPRGPLLDEVNAAGGVAVAVDIGGGVSTPTAIRNLRTLVRRLRPEIVHTHLARADILAALAAPERRPRLVSTEHHISPDRYMFHPTRARAVAMETVHRLRLTRFDSLIAVSASTERDMRRYWRTRRPITVIRNGVDRPADPPQRDPGLRFLSLSRLSAEKNVDMTLRVFALVLAQHPAATLTVAGSGDEADSLQRLAGELGIDDSVTFPGFIDAPAAMAQHDVILQPSQSDNLSYTLLDAVAQGMGVAASPIGGNPEILPDRCIGSVDDDGAFAAIAIEQALDLNARPVLPDTIPTVRQMTEQIAAVYEQMGV